MPITAFADIGKAPKELLQGGRSSGAFQFDPKVTVASTTSTGVTFTATAIKKSDKVDASLKAAYSTKKYSVDATYDPSNKISCNASLSEVAPGVKASSSVVLPDLKTAKLALEYSMPYLHLKTNVGLNATPVLDVAASTGYNKVVLGAETSYDTAKKAVGKYNFGIGYTAPDFQVAAFLTDKLSTAKVSYAHNLNAKSTVGGEVTRKLASPDTTFALGYSTKLASGAATKFKVDNTGLLSVLYETKLANGEKVGASLQVQATDLSKPVKYGFVLDL